MIKMSRKAKKAMAVALTAGMLASTAATPVMAATAGWKQNSKGWWYENADGTYPANKWAKINGVWYYFDANGYMLANSWVKDSAGKWYFVGANGAMKINAWAQDNAGQWYWLTDDGSMLEGGWGRINGKWYFFKNDGVMQTGAVKVEDKVYYLTSNGDMASGEVTIDDTTYTFDASGAATGDVIPTVTKAFKKDGTPVAIAEEERELSITSVTAITKNADGDFIVTALLSEAANTEDLENSTLTLTNGSKVVTAEFVSVSNATAVYKITNSSVLTPGDSSADGSYSVKGNGVDVATELTASYEETLVGNSVQGFVYYYDSDDDTYKVIKNAEVQVGSKTVKTDSNGYYSIAATSGIATVEVSASGFFGQTATTNVSRNYPSTQNVQLNVYNQKLLYINGTILDNANSTPVEGVKIELQKKNTDGTYSTIATANTTSTGEFGFGNIDSAIVTKDAESNVGSGQTDADGYVTFDDDDSNKLSKDATYQIVVSKDYKSNLYDAYNAQTIAVSLSTTDAQTNLKNIFLTAVKEISSAKVTLTWADDATLMTDTDETIYYLMDQDGSTVLASGAIENGTIDGKAMKEGVELVNVLKDADDVTGKFTLPTGTYYLVANDDTNAYCVMSVAVTEGTDVTVAGTVQKASAASLNTYVGTIVYEEVAEQYASDVYVIDANGSASSEKVAVNYDVYQVVNGKNVYVFPATESNFALSDNVVSATTEFSRLVAGESYVCVPDQDYIKADSKTITKISSGSINSTTNEVESAANIEVIDLTAATWVDADGTPLSSAPTDATITSLKIVDTKGNTVREVTGVEDVDFSVEVNTTAWSPEQYAKLKGIPAGEYKAVIEVSGYGAVTTDTFKLLDFQAATLSTTKTFTKDAVTTISGYLRFADNNEVVADDDDDTLEAIVFLYDSNGNLVAYNKVGSEVNQANYKIVNGENTGDNTVGLAAGTYKLVVRGESFETYEKQVVLKANETVTYNIEVTRHVGGQAKLAIRDTNNYGFGAGTNTLTPWLLDANYISSDSVLDKNNIIDDLSSVDSSFLGYYETTSVENSIVEYETDDILSKGTYTIVIPETDNAYYQEETITISSVNGTSYKDIVTTAISTGKTIPLTIQYDATIETDAIGNKINEMDMIVVEDENGKVIAKKFNDVDATATVQSVPIDVVADATYVVKVYSEGKFVASQKVTVQGFAKSVTVALDDATRN